MVDVRPEFGTYITELNQEYRPTRWAARTSLSKHEASEDFKLILQRRTEDQLEIRLERGIVDSILEPDGGRK